MTNSLIPTVTLIDGTPRVSSLEVAEKFGKRHCDVLRLIEKIMRDLEPGYRERNFALTFTEVPGPNGAVRKSPAYALTRDAFSLVAMGFTGKEALAWKVRYIEAFNAMEKELLKKTEPRVEKKPRIPRKKTFASRKEAFFAHVEEFRLRTVRDVEELSNEGSNLIDRERFGLAVYVNLCVLLNGWIRKQIDSPIPVSAGFCDTPIKLIEALDAMKQ